LLTGGGAVAAGTAGAAGGTTSLGRGDAAGVAATGAGAVGAGAVAGAGVTDGSGRGELRLRENFGHTVNTTPAMRIAAAALPYIGSRLASDARGRGSLVFGVALAGGGATGTRAAGGGDASTADGAGEGAIGNGAPTIVAAVIAFRCAGAATGGFAIAAASSGVILMRTVSAVALVPRGAGFGVGARRANVPSTTFATFGIVSATCVLTASASTATVPRNNESSAYTSTFTRQNPARCGVSRNAIRFE
jgi:hypothetical protein